MVLSTTTPEYRTVLRKVSTEERNRDIPEHLLEMYNKACDGKSPEEKELIQHVFCKYMQTFFQNAILICV